MEGLHTPDYCTIRLYKLKLLSLPAPKFEFPSKASVICMESALRDLKLLWSHWQEVFTDKEMNILEGYQDPLLN
jgi:hypothetical protein